MDAIKGIFNYVADPRLFFILSVLALVFIVWKRELFARNAVGYGLMGFLTVFFLFGLADENFVLIIAKPDNVPIVALIFLVIFFTWYAIREGVRNDQRMAAGDDPIEKQESDRVWVWPDLVYTELIALVLCSAVLVAWSILLEAPIEQPANPANTPNPSKAPWYFLGLQEMLVYFDPWLAGVVLPSLIIVGLMAIPFIDTNPKGNGYYTFNERKAEITIFLFGFVILWSSLIVLGTFPAGTELEFFRAVRVLGHPQAGSAEQRAVVGVPLGARARHFAARQHPAAGGAWHYPVDRLRDSSAVRPGPDPAQGLLREDGRDPVLRRRVPLPDDAVAADQDAEPVADQPEVCRLHPGVLLQHLTETHG